jgi:3-isopropylmalate/(R)-2-methylmalate dehydratase large subunit
MDHYIPAKDIASANQAKISREFAYKHDLKYFFDEKDMGIEHALLPEKGLVIPGDVIIGADSHTCTHGALGAFSTGMGSTDISFSIITGGNWFKVPESSKVHLVGKPGEHIYGKDIILELIRILGVDGALYKAIEFTGDGVQYLGMADRFSMCNMAIEAGAKSGIFAIDEISQAYLDERAEANGGLRAEPKLHYSDADATYCQEITIYMENLSPVIAYPFLPSNGKPGEQAVADD